MDRHTTAPTSDGVSRYYLLDALRGVAAFAILLWHYQHFQYYYGEAVYQPQRQPFSNALYILYTAGDAAVYCSVF